MVKSNPDLKIEMGLDRQNNQGKAPEETSPAEKIPTAARLVSKHRDPADQSPAAILSSLKLVSKANALCLMRCSPWFSAVTVNCRYYSEPGLWRCWVSSETMSLNNN